MIKKFKEFYALNESSDEKDLKDFILKNSYLDYEGIEDDVLSFSTRKNGSVSSETASNIDLTEGKKIAKLVNEKFPNYQARVEIVDEWILLFIEKKIEKEQKYSYSFIKHSDINRDPRKNTGYGETYHDIKPFLKTVKSFVPKININDVKKDINDIIKNDKFPNKGYNGDHSKIILLCNPGEKENWCNYYISMIINKVKI